jgi:hypothetical protein
MRPIICLTAALAFCAASAPAVAKPATAADAGINHSSWTYTSNGTKMRETIDADGNYITEDMAGKHIDHGTAAMKDGKVCFTSAMNDKGENCWTSKHVNVGQSTVATSDKGEKLKVTKVEYMPLSMPK